MPLLPNKDRCCGCTACYAVCPAHAISMQPDSEGFMQPVVDDKVCINCGRCEQVCPVLNPGKPRTPLAVYAAKAKDDELRRISSSGGIFSLLAREVLAKGGVVYGAAFEGGTFRVIHKSAHTELELDQLRGSKYVQSDLGNVFDEIRTILNNGRKVLFSGCPCQVAGLKRFIGADAKQLITVEVFCHAAPSPMVWQLFLEAQARESGDKISNVESRRRCKWREFEVAITFETQSGKKYLRKFPIWYSIFFKELCSRNSCYNCQMRDFRSLADISIGDFWGIEKVMPEVEDSLGVSVVTANTDAGIVLLNELSGEAIFNSTTLAHAAKKNKAIMSNEKVSSLRDSFMTTVNANNFNELAHKLTDPPKWFVMLRNLKRLVLG